MHIPTVRESALASVGFTNLGFCRFYTKRLLVLCDPYLFPRCIHFSAAAVLKTNNIEQHNSIMEVNEDGSNLPMILANKIE